METINSGRVLIVGDGDLSFSAAFAQQKASQISELVASVHQTEEQLLQTHSRAPEHVQHLAQYKNVVTVYDVDVKRLPFGQVVPQFDHFIFNFPHVGGKSNRRAARQLIGAILDGAQRVLSCNGTVYLTLAGGQSELDDVAENWVMQLDMAQMASVHNMDSWQIIYMAAEHRFIVHDVQVFSADRWPGYTSSGYKSGGCGFHQKRALTFQLRRATDDSATAGGNLDNEQTRMTTVIHDSGSRSRHATATYTPSTGSYHGLRPCFIHDVSFWCPTPVAPDTVPSLLALMADASTLIVHVVEVTDLRYDDAIRHAVSVVIRVAWQGVQIPLTRTQSNQLQEHLRWCLLTKPVDDRQWQLRCSWAENNRLRDQGLTHLIISDL